MTKSQRAGYGSSPRAWGLGDRVSRAWRSPRTLPTIVGPTTGSYLANAHRAVHSHEREEHASLTTPKRTRSDPSPRAWGALISWQVGEAVGRSIPTSVGSTLRRRVCRRRLLVHPTGVGSTCREPAATICCSAHPHERGDYSPPYLRFPPSIGSSHKHVKYQDRGIPSAR